MVSWVSVLCWAKASSDYGGLRLHKHRQAPGVDPRGVRSSTAKHDPESPSIQFGHLVKHPGPGTWIYKGDHWSVQSTESKVIFRGIFFKRPLYWIWWAKLTKLLILMGEAHQKKKLFRDSRFFYKIWSWEVEKIVLGGYGSTLTNGSLCWSRALWINTNFPPFTRNPSPIPWFYFSVKKQYDNLKTITVKTIISKKVFLILKRFEPIRVGLIRARGAFTMRKLMDY